MFDGFWSGVFGGLFGPFVSHWLSRLKYWIVFLVSLIGWQLFFSIMAIYYKGLSGLNDIFIHDRSSFLIIFIYAPIGFSLFVVTLTFLGSLNKQNNKNKLLDNVDKNSGNS